MLILVVLKPDSSISMTIRIIFTLSSLNQQMFEVLYSLSLQDAMIQYLKAIGYPHPSLQMKTLVVVLHGSSSALSNLDVSVGSLAKNFQLHIDCWLNE